MTSGDRTSDGRRDESRLIYRTELLRADVAARLAIDLGDVPGGGPVRWELAIDAVRVACTDELLTDDAAVAWARRMLGEGVTFLVGCDTGGYWVAGPTCGVDEWPPLAVPAGGSGSACTSGTAVASETEAPS